MELVKEKEGTKRSPNEIGQELMLIDGKWTVSADGRFFPVENPALRDSVIAEVPRAGSEDVDLAVNAASKAFESWRKVAPRERGKLMIKIADELEGPPLLWNPVSSRSTRASARASLTATGDIK
jgi:betaine-aldehyde dehydrogenase